MRTIVVRIKMADETVLSAKVVALRIFGNAALHHPFNDDDRLYYTLTHIPTGRSMLDDFVIDARLDVEALTPLFLEFAALFAEPQRGSLSEVEAAVRDALIRVIEHMEEALPVRRNQE